MTTLCARHNFMIDIDKLTIGELRQLQSVFPGTQITTTKSNPFLLGKAYFIRTVTHHFTGRLVAVYDIELVFEDVAWIADDGRLADALKTGNFNEVEPYPDGQVIIGRGSLIDASLLTSTLPRSQK